MALARAAGRGASGNERQHGDLESTHILTAFLPYLTPARARYGGQNPGLCRVNTHALYVMTGPMAARVVLERLARRALVAAGVETIPVNRWHVVTAACAVKGHNGYGATRCSTRIPSIDSLSESDGSPASHERQKARSA